MNIFRSITFIALIIVGTIIAHGTVHAATLSMKPKTSAVKVGTPLTVKLVLDSANQPVNSAEATITFQKKLLKFTKVATKESVFSLWAIKPFGSNKAGTVAFAAGKKNPGFKGRGAIIIRITFIPKKAGTANVKITKANVLANDGKGTNVLTKVSNTKVQIQ